MKECTKCGEAKALDCFGTDKRAKDGARSCCKVCRRADDRAYSKAYREVNPEKTKAAQKAYYAANQEKQRARARAWQKANPEKVKAAKKAYHEANKDKINTRNKNWREANPGYQNSYYKANPEKMRSLAKAWREANPEKAKATEKKWREANPEKAKATGKKWREANPEKINAYRKANLDKFAAATRKRYADKLKRTPQWSDLMAIEMFYSEARIKSDETGEKHHVDHIIPLRGKLVSGLHVPNNLQVITAAENHKKNNKYDPLLDGGV